MAEEGNKFKPEEYPEDRGEAAVALDSRLASIEEDLDVLHKRRKAERDEFKKTTGISLGVFDGARRDANIEDETKRQTKLTNYVTVFNALSGEEQMELTGIIDHSAEEAPENSEAA